MAAPQMQKLSDDVAGDDDMVHIDIHTPHMPQYIVPAAVPVVPSSLQCQNNDSKLKMLTDTINRLTNKLANQTCNFLTLNEAFYGSDKKLDSVTTYMHCQQIGIFFSSLGTCIVKFIDTVFAMKLAKVTASPLRVFYHLLSPTVFILLEILVTKLYNSCLTRIARFLQTRRNGPNVEAAMPLQDMDDIPPRLVRQLADLGINVEQLLQQQQQAPQPPPPPPQPEPVPYVPRVPQPQPQRPQQVVGQMQPDLVSDDQQQHGLVQLFQDSNNTNPFTNSFASGGGPRHTRRPRSGHGSLGRPRPF